MKRNKVLLLIVGLSILLVISVNFTSLESDSKEIWVEDGQFSSDWYAQVESIINGSQIGSFDEAYLLNIDEDYHRISSTAVGGNQKVEAQYKYNFSDLPPNVIERLSLRYAYNTTTASPDRLVTHFNDSGDFAAWTITSGTFDAYSDSGDLLYAKKGVSTSGYAHTKRDLPNVPTNNITHVSFHIREKLWAGDIGEPICSYTLELVYTDATREMIWWTTSIRYEEPIDRTFTVTRALDSKKTIDYIDLELIRSFESGPVEVWIYEEKYLGYAPATAQPTVSLFNYTDSTWLSIIEEPGAQSQTSNRALEGNLSDFFNPQSILLVKVEAINLSGSPFILLINQLLINVSTALPYFHFISQVDIFPTIRPLPSVFYLNFSCLVFDTHPGLHAVLLQENLTGSIINHLMQNETLSKYWYYLDISSLTTETLAYRFWANDTEGNANWTQWYYVERDYEGPSIMSWGDPLTPEYDDAVNIFANITDLNGVSSVKMTWSLDWIVNISRTMTNVHGNTWKTNLPIPNHAHDTSVAWEIWANDTGGNVAVEYFSYQVMDETKPEVLDIHYILPAQAGTPFTINITMAEPAGASGIDPNTAFLRYTLSSEGYNTTYEVTIDLLPGDVWSVSIPAQEAGETVLWRIYVQDLAGNSYESEIYGFTVVEEAELIDWVNFGWWALLVLLITGAFTIYRRHSARKGKNRLAGTKFLGAGIASVIGATTITWLGPLAWFDLRNLAFQEWMLQVGQTDSWFFLILLLSLMFFTLGASLGTLYHVDKRTAAKWAGREIQRTLHRINQDLQEKFGA